MKIFIHGNGDWAKEISYLINNYKYYKNYYKYELGKKKFKYKKIKCYGFSHTETLESFKIKEIKNDYHLICSSKKRDIFEKYIIDNNLKVLPYFLLNSPIIGKKNKIGKGVIALHTYFTNEIEIGDFSYIGPLNVISNRVKINKNCIIFQKNTFSNDVVIGANTVITSNCIINKGIKIGENCYIGPNQNIISDIEDNTTLIEGKKIKGLKI